MSSTMRSTLPDTPAAVVANVDRSHNGDDNDHDDHDAGNIEPLRIRQLRRRLWHALMREDGDEALEWYTMTRATFESLLLRIEQQRQHEQEQQRQLQQQLEEAAAAAAAESQHQHARKHNNNSTQNLRRQRPGALFWQGMSHHQSSSQPSAVRNRQLMSRVANHTTTGSMATNSTVVDRAAFPLEREASGTGAATAAAAGITDTNVTKSSRTGSSNWTTDIGSNQDVLSSSHVSSSMSSPMAQKYDNPSSKTTMQSEERLRLDSNKGSSLPQQQEQQQHHEKQQQEQQHLGLLQLHMNPFEYFVEDDFYHPTDPYPDDLVRRDDASDAIAMLPDTSEQHTTMANKINNNTATLEQQQQQRAIGPTSTTTTTAAAVASLTMRHHRGGRRRRRLETNHSNNSNNNNSHGGDRARQALPMWLTRHLLLGQQQQQQQQRVQTTDAGDNHNEHNNDDGEPTGGTDDDDDDNDHIGSTNNNRKSVTTTDAPVVDPHATTLWHQAARLAHVGLLHAVIVLQQPQQQHQLGYAIDVNVRNGQGQTALHLVAGGMNAAERAWYNNTIQQQEQRKQQPSPAGSATNPVSSSFVAMYHDRPQPSQGFVQQMTAAEDSAAAAAMPSRHHHHTALLVMEQAAAAQAKRAVRAVQKIMSWRGGGGTSSLSSQQQPAQQQQTNMTPVITPQQPQQQPQSHTSQGPLQLPSDPTTNSSNIHANLFTNATAVTDASYSNHGTAAATQMDLKVHVERMTEARVQVARTLLQWNPAGAIVASVEPTATMPGLHHQTNESMSLHAIDGALGRTALHYAAECGRTMLCDVLLEPLGAMLTIVDDAAHTPCELAAQHDHIDLAATLEARAVLYVDPYGMEEELCWTMQQQQQQLQQQWGSNNNNNNKASCGIVTIPGMGPARSHRSQLVPPFGWWETVEAASTERSARLQQTFLGMKKTLDQMRQRIQAKDAMLLHTPQQPNPEAMDAATMAAAEQVKAAAAVVEAPVGDTDTLSAGTHADACSGNVHEDCETGEEHVVHQPSSISNLDPGSNETFDDTGKSQDPEGQDSNSLAQTNVMNDRLAETNVMNDRKGPYNDALSRLSAFHWAHVERCLIHHSWNVKRALRKFRKDPVAAWMETGMILPWNEGDAAGAATATDSSSIKEDGISTCLICCDSFHSSHLEQWISLSGCEHGFCVDCLVDYLDNCQRNQSSGWVLSCPHHACEHFLAWDDVKQVLERRGREDWLQGMTDRAVDQFVAAAADLGYCPHAGCSGVVKFTLPACALQVRSGTSYNPTLLQLVGAVCTMHADRPRKSHDGVKQSKNAADDPPEQPSVVRYTYEGDLDQDYDDCCRGSEILRAHRFCFLCGDMTKGGRGGHWPVSCDRLQTWKDEVRNTVQQCDRDGELGSSKAEDGEQHYTDISHRLWMKANTRPCPKCKAPIQKNDGCNHMTCSNPVCKYEFCWICRNDWKLHNTDTGGYFRCNRWVDQKEQHEFYDKPPEDLQAILHPRNEDLSSPATMQATYGTAMHEAVVSHQKSRNMNRFLHHYQRWSAHAESATLERHMAETAQARLKRVVHAAMEFYADPSFNFGGAGLSFVHDAFTELLECRSVLQHSYPFSFYRYQSSHPTRYRLLGRRMTEKLVFEQAQAELERMTEQISDVVARAHLRATQSQIVFLTTAASDKRKEFSNLMVNILTAEQNEEKEAAKADTSNSGGSSAVLPSLSQRWMSSSPPNGMLDRISGLAPAHDSEFNSEERNVVDNDDDDNDEDDDSEEEPTIGSSQPHRRIRQNRRHLNQRRQQEQAYEDLLDRQVQEALRASLEDFLAVSPLSSSGDALEESSAGSALNDEADNGDNWACAACTYLNVSGSHRCSMCGTVR